MARGGSQVRTGGIYHVISRFVAKEWFISSSLERRVYRSLFGAAISKTDWRCFSYALMSSHLHFALLAGTDSLASWMRPMHTLFAQWLNARHERIGAVFVKGPNVIAFQPRATAKLIQYIHFNPVRARVVSDPADCDWTSHRAYLGLAQRPSWLDIDGALEFAGIGSVEAFRAWSESCRVDRRDLVPMRLFPPRERGRPIVRDQVEPKRRNPPEQEAGFFE